MNRFGSKARNATETQDHDALWAVRADPRLLCYNYTVTYSLLFFSLIVAKWLILSGFSIPPIVPFILLTAFIAIIVFLGARMHSARTVYVGSERGICACFGRMLESGVFVVKHTSYCVEYDRITDIKMIEALGRRILIFNQGPSLAAFSLSAIFGGKQAPKFGSAKQYRGLSLAFDGEKIWVKRPSSEATRESETSTVCAFIDQRTERFTIVNSMANGIFCDETTLRFVIAQVLPSNAYRNRAYRGRHYLAVGGG